MSKTISSTELPDYRGVFTRLPLRASSNTKICDAFGITVNEFFSEDITPHGDEVILLSGYRKLTTESKKMLRYIIENMK